MRRFTKLLIICALTVIIGVGSLSTTGGLFDAYKVWFEETQRHTKWNNFLDAASAKFTALSSQIGQLSNLRAVYVAASWNAGIWPSGPDYIVAADYGTSQTALSQADSVAAATGKQLVIGQSYTISSDLTLASAVKIMPGALLIRSGGTHLTINKLAEDPGLYQWILDNSINHDWLQLGTGAIMKILPQWWGAVAENPSTASSDNATAINAAATCCRTAWNKDNPQTLYFAPGCYRVLSNLNLTDCNIEMAPKAFIRSAIISGSAVRVGCTSRTDIYNYMYDRRFNMQITLEVEQAGTYDAHGNMTYDYPAGTVGIEVASLSRSSAHIRRSAGFETALNLKPPIEGDISYSKFNIEYLIGKIDIWIDASNNFISVNDFFGGHFNSPYTLGGFNPIGVRFTGGGHYIHDNVFYKPVFELGFPRGSNYSYCAYFDDDKVIGNVCNNTFKDVYLEQCNYGCYFGNYVNNNEFEVAYLSGTSILSNVSSTVVNNGNNYQNYAYYKWHNWADWGKVLIKQCYITGGIKSENYYYPPPGLSVDGGTARKVTCNVSPYYSTNCVYTSANAIGFFVNTSLFKSFRAEMLYVAGYNPGRINVHCYDANFKELTGSSPAYAFPTPYPNMGGDSSMAWRSPTYQSGYQFPFTHFTVRDEVKYIWVGLSTGDPNVRANGFSLWGFLPEAARSQTSGPGLARYSATRVTAPQAFQWKEGFSNDTQQYAPSIPTTGFFQTGNIVLNLAAASGSAPFWSCINRQDTTVSSQASAGYTTIKVSSTKNMFAGDNVGIVLDDGTMHWTTITSITDGTHLAIKAGIPPYRSALAGAAFYTNRWKAAANLP